MTDRDARFAGRQESTSEDVNFFYAMTMWAMATGNSKLEGLGRLQTGVVARSIDSYFLLKDSNQNHPVDFVRNKVWRCQKQKYRARMKKGVLKI